jgi:hypothetical protein
MKPLEALSLLLSYSLFLQSTVAGTASDHLVPPDKDETAYRHFVMQKLCPTAFDYGRAIIQPPFEHGEECISIYSLRDTTRITYTSAESSLRDASDAGRQPFRARDIKVRRLDAKLSAETGKLLHDVWIRMLTEHQKPRPWERGTTKVFLDPTIVEFSVSSAGKDLVGTTPLVAAELGAKVQQFFTLSEKLIDYAKNPSADREKQIQLLAKRLLAQLS